MVKTALNRVCSVFLATMLLATGSGETSCIASPLPGEGAVIGTSPAPDEPAEDTGVFTSVPEEEHSPEILKITEYEKKSGSCGPEATYSVKQQGTAYPYKYALYITGSSYIDNYNSTPAPWTEYSDSICKIVIGEGITTIGFNAFEGCGTNENINNLEVSLPSTLRYIANSGFKDCSKLKNIFMPESVRFLGYGAFQGCSSLAGMCFFGSSSESPLSIEPHAFDGCSSMEYFSFPRYVSRFGANSFANGCRVVIYYPANGVFYNGEYYPDAGKALGDAMKLDGLSTYEYRKDKTSCGMKGFIGSGSEELTFTYDSRDDFKQLYFRGSGSMLSFNYKEKYPWYTESPRTVYVDDKIESIGDHAFENMNSLVAADFRSSKLSSIGKSAFADCSGLSSISFFKGSDSGISIGDKAFMNCQRLSDGSLLSLISSSEGKGKVSSIGKYAFYKCPAKTINFGVTFNIEINDYAFANCKKLEKLNLNSQTLKGPHIFDNCTALGEVTLNLGNTDIPQYTFYRCSSLKKLKIEKVRNINVSAFCDCVSLDNPEIGTVNTIKSNAFFGSNGIKTFNTGNASAIEDCIIDTCEDLYIGKAVTSIKAPLCSDPNDLKLMTVDPANTNYVSSDDGSMILDKATRKTLIYGVGTDVIIPHGVETIGQSAFDHLTNMKTVSIPESVNKIERYAFYECSNLEKVFFRGSSEQWNGITIGEYDDETGEWDDTNDYLKTAPKEFLVKSGDFAGGNLHWEVRDNKLTITKNGSYTGTEIPDFSNASQVPWHHLAPDITEVDADFVTSVGDHAFSGFRILTMDNLNLGSVTEIGDHAFENCSSFTSLSKFESCDLSIGGIGNSAFKGCTGLTSITLYNYGEIKENAFGNCSRLETVDTGDSTVTLDQGVFNGCLSLKDLTIGTNTQFSAPLSDSPDSLETLQVAAGNTSYNNSDDNTYITNEEGTALLMGTNKTDIPDGIGTIGTGAFYGMSSLETITIPYDVTEIKDNAFYGCTGLTNINYLGKKADWNERLAPHIGSGNDVLDVSKINWLATEGTLENGLNWKIESRTLNITRPSGILAEDIPDFENALSVP